MSSKFNRPRRPIDKENMYIISTSLGTTQDKTTIRTATVAETYVGGHIQLSMIRVSGGGVVNCALVVIPEGLSVPTISTTDGNPIFTPEEYVVWSGSYFIGGSSVEPLVIKEKLKAMRKMKNGDELAFIARGSVATVATVTANITAFFKQ